MPPTDGNETLTYRLIDWLIGKENLTQFRDDFKWIAYREMDNFKRWDATPIYLKKEAQEARDFALGSKWDRVGFLIGILTSFSIFITIPLNRTLTLIGLIIALLTALRRVTVTMLVFHDPYRIYHHQQLKFACAWNRAMNGWTSTLVIPVGILNSVAPEKYKLGLWLLEDVIEDRYS